MSSNKQKIFAWLGGICFSAAFAWTISIVFLNSVIPQVWDEDLGEFIRKPGIVVRFRSEGWGNTAVGEHGILGGGDVVLSGGNPCLLLWGDSHLEAYQVDDRYKVASVFNSLNKDLQAASISRSGLSVADYYFLIPRFEKMYPNISAHVILLSGMDDVTPGRQNSCNGRFFADPWRFERGNCTLSPLALKWGSMLYKFRLEPYYQLYRDVKDWVADMRIAVAPAPTATKIVRNSKLGRAWDFLVHELSTAAEKPIVFVYCPYGPRIVNGNIDFTDRNAKEKEQFKEHCTNGGVGFIDMTEAFSDLFSEERKLPRGFFNTPQGQGHFNADGQALIAEAINAYFHTVEQ